MVEPESNSSVLAIGEARKGREAYHLPILELIRGLSNREVLGYIHLIPRLSVCI